MMNNSSKHICEDIIQHIEDDKPFSIQRMGDAEYSMLYDNVANGNTILSNMRSITQGIPKDKLLDVKKMLVHSANIANYVTSYDPFRPKNEWSGYFPGVKKSNITLNAWRWIYEKIGITNTNYCNGDVCFHLFIEGISNLLDYLKDRRICIVTSKPNTQWNLQKFGFLDVTRVSVPYQTSRQEYVEQKPEEPLINMWHYDRQDIIKRDIKLCIDHGVRIYLVAAGFLAKGYCAFIKENGGIAIDIGKYRFRKE